MNLIFTLIPTGAFLICVLVYTKGTENTFNRLIRIFYIINTFCLLCSCLIYYNESLPQNAGLDDGPLRWLFEVLMWPYLFNIIFRLVFIPYIYFAILTYLYIKGVKRKLFPKKETFLFIVLLLLSILGLICLEFGYQDFIQHLGSV